MLTFTFCSNTFRYPLLDTIGDTRTSSISGTNKTLPTKGDRPEQLVGPLPLLPSVAGVPDDVITDWFAANKLFVGILTFSSKINERGLWCSGDKILKQKETYELKCETCTNIKKSFNLCLNPSDNPNSISFLYLKEMTANSSLFNLID